MSKNTMIALAASAVLSLAAAPAFAADNGIYLGGSVGQAGVSIEEPSRARISTSTPTAPPSR